MVPAAAVDAAWAARLDPLHARVGDSAGSWPWLRSGCHQAWMRWYPGWASNFLPLALIPTPAISVPRFRYKPLTILSWISSFTQARYGGTDLLDQGRSQSSLKP